VSLSFRRRGRSKLCGSFFSLLAGLTGFSIQLTSFKFYRYFDNRTVFLATMWLILLAFEILRCLSFNCTQKLLPYIALFLFVFGDNFKRAVRCVVEIIGIIFYGQFL